MEWAEYICYMDYWVHESAGHAEIVEFFCSCLEGKFRLSLAMLLFLSGGELINLLRKISYELMNIRECEW